MDRLRRGEGRGDAWDREELLMQCAMTRTIADETVCEKCNFVCNEEGTITHWTVPDLRLYEVIIDPDDCSVTFRKKRQSLLDPPDGGSNIHITHN